MPKDVSKEVVEDLERVLKPGGYWFIKMNPYYSKEELESFGYENMGNNIYEENHIMRLRQATTNYWKERFARFGKEIIYLEFEYPWQEGNESFCLFIRVKRTWSKESGQKNLAVLHLQ